MIERKISRRATFHQALTDFADKVRELNKTATDGRSYVLVGELQAWMRATSLTMLDNKYVTNTDLLAHAVYHDTHDFPPIESSQIADADPDCCVIVFSILLDLGLGHLVDLFSKKTIVDRQLPEHLSSLKRKLKSLPDGEHVAERFNERQWKFCPAIFSFGMEKEYFANWIIPICREAPLNSGGTAHVRQIVVQSQFVHKNLKNLLAEDAYEDRDHGPCYIFALKTFEAGKFQYYLDEKKAFDGLRGNRGVIRRLGCYSHRLPSSSAPKDRLGNEESQAVEGRDTMNLLLEYGTLDLRLVFGHQLPPVSSNEIVAFWEALFEVADALSGIHEFKTGGSEFNGWHADIKPENIIYVRGKYKLADPGFARFKKKAQDQGVAPQIRLHGGTDTYGAPEVRSQTAAHQTIDTWSLGCVFSMAATWVVLGYQGVRQYQLMREKVLSSLLTTVKDDRHPLLVSQGFTVSTKPEKLDCFHNGTDVLSEITSWHTVLRNLARKADPITDEVLNLIDQKMLLQDPNERMQSIKLCAELRRIISSSRKALRINYTEETSEARDHRKRIENLLCEIDVEAEQPTIVEAQPEPTHPFPAGLPADRGALKVQLDNVPLKKTSHRFETTPVLRSTPTVPEAIAERPTMATSDTRSASEVLHRSTEPTNVSAIDKRHSFRRSTFDPSSRTNTGITNLTYRKTGIEPSTHTVQNVIQARESMDRDLKRKGTSLSGMLPKKKLRKDEYLSKHFKDRDIKFLVDDAETMLEHWDEATYLLETLVMKSHDQDPDGPDLDFTNDNTNLRRQKDTSAFRRAMQKVRPKKGSQIHTNMKTVLTTIFNNYLGMVKHTHDRSKVNALTVIILTDGLWEGLRNKDEVDDKIVEFYEQLKTKMDGMMKDRQVSIQFIHFGNDEEARERLRRLDDDMPYRGVEDMIDFETFSVTGNVLKMLLGSFVEEMDAINDNDSTDDLPSPDGSTLFQAPGLIPATSLPLRPISEDVHEGLPLSSSSSATAAAAAATYPCAMEQALPSLPPPQQQKTKKSRRFSKFMPGSS